MPESRIFPSVTPRSFFTVLIALAMLFAPLAMRSGSAAAMPADHHAEMTGAAHCDDQPATDPESKSADQSCCVTMSMCTAIAIAPLTPTGPRLLRSSQVRPSLARIYQGFLAELPTPPPRLA